MQVRKTAPRLEVWFYIYKTRERSDLKDFLFFPGVKDRKLYIIAPRASFLLWLRGSALHLSAPHPRPEPTLHLVSM